MPSQPEEVLDHAVNRKEPLGLSRRLESTHLPFSLPGRLMWDLSPIVCILSGVVLVSWATEGMTWWCAAE